MTRSATSTRLTMLTCGAAALVLGVTGCARSGEQGTTPSSSSAGKTSGTAPQTARKPVTTRANRAVLATAEVPAYCGHKAGRLTKHRGQGTAHLVMDDSDRTPVAVDMDGDGTEDLVAVYACAVKGQASSDALVAIDGKDGHLVSWIDPATWSNSEFKTAITALKADKDAVRLTYKAADVELSKGLSWLLRASMVDGAMKLAPADPNGTSVRGPIQVLPFYLNSPGKTSKLPHIADLRTFAAAQMAKATAKDGCDAYLGFDKLDPSGTVTAFMDSCKGAKTRQVWAVVKGKWQLVTSWDDKAKGPECKALEAFKGKVSATIVPKCAKGGQLVAR